MQISIAMTTYNGEKFLADQLESFVNQTRLPDELIICDDLSSDNTWNILEQFKNSSAFEVKLYRNAQRLGYSKNFEKALSICTGDVIFISDQDDVWFSNKIADTLKIFDEDSKTLVIINDQQITFDNFVPSKFTNYSNTFSAGLSDSWLSAGCCTALRSSFKSCIFPFPHDLIPYDGWIHKLAVLLNVRFVNTQVLQYHRRHSSNSSSSIVAQSRPPNIFSMFMHYGLKDVRRGWANEILLN